MGLHGIEKVNNVNMPSERQLIRSNAQASTNVARKNSEHTDQISLVFPNWRRDPAP
jgi:hypothetical protein